ncbi:CvpA family protein [Fervidibacter sacchari]|uniref:Membrane protein required for colicin V production n=1 Tax=Candidatus Fervidibacter sacchari TaxID=1448929 RepID=A0ABT2EQW7_9BACT|nr:CvpA family protein [Candidatus Fervidibacter sacchari]MCS3920362.1 putative membrane protein required for colicin V production [Candidatus Fervidibacter sacchari]WKU14678.1 CvpA family protein [Candidatus Fervidibacter sacchari]
MREGRKMTWLDGLCIVLILLIASVSSWQGTVRTAVAMVGFYIGGKLSQFFAERLALSVQWFASVDANKAVLFVVAFIVLGAITIAAAYFLDQALQLSLEEVDHLIAFPLGLIVGVILTHWLVQMLVWVYGAKSSFAALIGNSPVAKEMLTFQATKGAIAALFQWKESP